MIGTIVAILSLIGIVGIILLKLLNVFDQGAWYPGRFVLIGFAGALICWLLFFMSLSGSIISEETIITPDASTYTISDNTYATYSMYMGVVNLFVGVITLLTVFEILFMFNVFKDVKKPLRARHKDAIW